MAYVLDEDMRDRLAPKLAADLLEMEGADLVVRREGAEGVVQSDRGELRFAPGGEHTDLRGQAWSVEGETEALALTLDDGRVTSTLYPDALGRLWSALESPWSGDVLVSAEPGFEFVDWGGADHVGGGSHGSLHRGDSLGVLLCCGLDLPEREQWSLADVTPLVLDHFKVPS
jgi:hypothetical protein